MRTLSKEEFEHEKGIIINNLKESNLVFIYPTDTIYGIGCNAMNKIAVGRIRKIKQRPNNPFSVIAPSKEWIFENCEVNDAEKKWIEKLPGPYTLILKIKKGCVAENVAPGLKTLGIRIPKHWFSAFADESGIPIVTTSVNRSQSDFMTSLDDLDDEIKSSVDFIVYEGILKGKPSTVVNLTDKEKIIKR